MVAIAAGSSAVATDPEEAKGRTECDDICLIMGCEKSSFFFFLTTSNLQPKRIRG